MELGKKANTGLTNSGGLYMTPRGDEEVSDNDRLSVLERSL